VLSYYYYYYCDPLFFYFTNQRILIHLFTFPFVLQHYFFFRKL
jgi:hypothetical protein